MNRLISFLRSTIYWLTEPLTLRILRLQYDDDYDPNTIMFNDAAPLVSVYVPTHNRCELLIERCLKSVLAQSYRNFEIIVAAHGCTDETVRQVRDLADGQRRTFTYYERGQPVHSTTGTIDIRVIEVPRTPTYPESPENHWFAGPVVPANAALEQCRGAWVARIDDDDEWTPDHLEKLLYAAQDHNLEFISSAYETHEKIIQHDGHKIPIGGTQTWLYRFYLAAFKYNPDCWRKSWNRVNDTDLAQRFRNMGVRIGHLPEVTAKVLPRPGESTVGLEVYRAKGTAHLAFS